VLSISLQLGCPPDQRAIILLDCWPVHKSSFKEFMAKRYPFFILLFVPASCTSKAQVRVRSFFMNFDNVKICTL